MTRGSRKHVLDWTEQPRFLVQLLELLQPVECHITRASRWKPMGRAEPEEARLSQFGPEVLPGASWPALSSWWLKNAGNTPNWDIALQCEIEGNPGLVLVEAKAHVSELSEAGKSTEDDRSERSAENHEHIGGAILEARTALSTIIPGIKIDRDTHFQLSNRLAFGWKLASMGIPTVIIYLGFTGDEGMRTNSRAPFDTDTHWQAEFQRYLAGVCPASVLDAPLDLNAARLWVLSRSRPVLSSSSKRDGSDEPSQTLA